MQVVVYKPEKDTNCFTKRIVRKKGFLFLEYDN